mmetsp:Transcript_88371/g.189787  ORF Transcript_88371/g.189787 Transcript_88371/m.189787 type:complete len:447 (-) Transcript_88371:83-1423(-)
MSSRFSSIPHSQFLFRSRMRKAGTYALTSVALILAALASSTGTGTLGFVGQRSGRVQAPSKFVLAHSGMRFQKKSQQAAPSKMISDVLQGPRAEILRKQARRPHKQELLFSWGVYALLTVLGTVVASLALHTQSFGLHGAWSHFLADPTHRGVLLAIPAVVLLGTLWQGFQVWRWNLAGGLGVAAAKAFGAHQASKFQPLLEERVAALGARAGLPPGCPRVFVVPTQEPNAFAAGLTPENSVVAVTEGLLNEDLTSDELDAVLAHEIGHIFNGDCASGMQIAVMVAGFSSLLSLGVRFMDAVGRESSSDKDSDDNSAVVLALAMVLAGSLLYSFGYVLQAWHSRRREFVADEAAVALTGTNALASALAKIDQAAWKTKSGRALVEQKPQFSHLYISSHSDHTSGFFRFVSNLLRFHPRTKERKRAIGQTLQTVAPALPQPRSTVGQ